MRLRRKQAREVTQMARRIAALRLLEPSLDANYALVKAAATVISHRNISRDVNGGRHTTVILEKGNEGRSDESTETQLQLECEL